MEVGEFCVCIWTWLQAFQVPLKFQGADGSSEDYFCYIDFLGRKKTQFLQVCSVTSSIVEDPCIIVETLFWKDTDCT